MRKLSLTFPQQIADQLQLLCFGKPKVCKKESRLGWTNNDRILLVRDNYIEYYNLHPGFIEDDPNSVKRKYFKAGVRLDFIHEVNFLPKNKIKKNYLEIIFPQRKKINKPHQLLKANDNEEDEQTKGGEEEKLQKWLFQFTNDLKEYIQARKENRKQQKRTMAKIQPMSLKQIGKFLLDMGNLNNESTPKSLKNASTPKSLKNAQKHQKNIEQYVNSINKTKSLLKTKAEMAEEEAARQKKKKEKQMAELVSSKNQNLQQTYTISTFWREYFKYYEAVIKKQNRQKLSFQEKIQNQVVLLRQIDYFNTVAVKTVKCYVDELIIGSDSSKKQFQDFKYYQGLWLKSGDKQLNQQFLVNYYLNDILYSLRQIKGFKFRLPLMSLIRYKGYKMLCMCDMPFSQLDKTEVYNLLNDGFDLQFMARLKESLDVLEDVLNVKSQPYDADGKKKMLAPLGNNLKIYEYSFNKDKSQDQITLPNFYYLINPGKVFPIDYNYQKQKIDERARLRPQLVAFFRDYYKEDNPQLLVQAFMQSSMPQDFKKQQDLKVIQASKLIFTYKLPELIGQLNQMSLIFVDSYSIKSIMQEMGINIRYLYVIYQKVELPYVREIIVAQVLARTIKKQFHQALKDIQTDFNIAEKLEGIKNQKERIKIISKAVDEGQSRYLDMALDYLNLVFGSGAENQVFWKIIIKKCHQYYNIKPTFPLTIRHGMLLNAVLWSCGLSLSFPPNIPLFQTDEPFKDCKDLQFITKLKTFDFPSFQIQKLFRGAPSLEDKVDFDIFKQSSSKLLKLQLLFNKNLSNFSFQSQVSMAKLSNYHEYLQKPISKNKLHPIFIPYYLMNKSHYNFQRAIQILNFALPETHPLFINCYIEYAQFFQPQILKKTALMLAVKSFGEFHPKTTEMYSKFYHQGFSQYYLKAKRVDTVDACCIICLQMFQNKLYKSCLNYCIDQITKINSSENTQKIGTGNYKKYLDMLMQGLHSSIELSQLDQGIIISKEISNIISSFKFKNQSYTEILFQKTLILHLLKQKKKYFLYKMVLFVIHIKRSYETVELDEQGCTLPCTGKERSDILDGISSQYYEKQNHSNWIQYIFSVITKSFQYFNFLQDLFNNFEKHLRRYNNESFKICLGYLDLLIRLYGQRLFKQMLYDIKFSDS